MQTCAVLGCGSVKDCVATPRGSVCICKGDVTGRMCLLDAVVPSEWGRHFCMNRHIIFLILIVYVFAYGIALLVMLYILKYNHQDWRLTFFYRANTQIQIALKIKIKFNRF